MTTDSTGPANNAGWRALFTGKNTDGWEMVGPGELKLENGELVTHGGMGLLWYSRERFRNYQVRVIFKLNAPDDNSGVFIRIPGRPQTPWDGVNKGYEVQIDNTGDEWHRTGCLYSLTKARNIVAPKVGEWATMLITVDGKRTVIEIDGQLVTDYTEGQPVPEKKIWHEPDRGPRPEYGYIGLQNHGGEAHVRFKEVRVRPLSKAKQAKAEN
ncbi:MAG: DUF1080 domain-containing protein [Pedosphaera sp.]|nr:DUF1080 domain-containing protein [Pedosphaera sp.]